MSSNIEIRLLQADGACRAREADGAEVLCHHSDGLWRCCDENRGVRGGGLALVVDDDAGDGDQARGCVCGVKVGMRGGAGDGACGHRIRVSQRTALRAGGLCRGYHGLTRQYSRRGDRTGHGRRLLGENGLGCGAVGEQPWLYTLHPVSLRGVVTRCGAMRVDRCGFCRACVAGLGVGNWATGAEREGRARDHDRVARIDARGAGGAGRTVGRRAASPAKADDETGRQAHVVLDALDL